jgi:DNA-binding transcriptional ArsR family regulator
MIGDTQIAEVAALVGDPARANILAALMDGRALTASELAYAARVSPQTTSGHLAKLTEARLLSMAKQGRHRYYRLASPLVGSMLESIMAVASEGPPRHRPRSPRDEALRTARTCYDHLAGRLGVALADALVERGHVVIDGDGGTVTETGQIFLTALGLDLEGGERSRRPFCRPCLDWTERRAHLAGKLGAALATHCFEAGWIARPRQGGRAVEITREGEAGLAATFGVALSS